MSEDRRMEAEQRYLAGDETLQEMAKAMGLPLSSLKRWCKAGDWVNKLEALKKRALRKAATQVVEKKAKALARIMEASDEIEKALLCSARALAERAADNPSLFLSRSVNKMVSVTEGIERMAHARAMTGSAMSAADKKKIAILMRKQRLDEKQAAKAEQEASEGVRFEIGPDEESEEYSE